MEKIVQQYGVRQSSKLQLTHVYAPDFAVSSIHVCCYKYTSYIVILKSSKLNKPIGVGIGPESIRIGIKATCKQLMMKSKPQETESESESEEWNLESEGFHLLGFCLPLNDK